MSKTLFRWELGCVAVLATASSALAEIPTVKLQSGVLVSPSAAFTSGGHTDGVIASQLPAPPEIKALARTLGAGRDSGEQFAQNVLDYVRNNVDTEFRFGLGKGARGALIDQSGTPFDQAELMVKLLAEGGVTATFHAGAIQLNAQQFGKWTGLVKGLTESNQSFTVDARAACKLLADGGIPATVNGSSDCAAVTGDLNQVVMASVWVSALGKVYDPSFKAYTLYNGVDIAAAAGCGGGCGAAMTAAATGAAVHGSTNGLSTITNVQEATLYSKLREFAVNLQGNIQSDPTRKIEQVVGGRRLILGFSAPASSQLPYGAPPANAVAWSQIPDAYRTRLRLRTAFADVEFFSDEIAGRRLQLIANNTYQVDFRTLSLPGCASACLPEDHVVSLSINHPYPANGGTYGDDTAILPLNSGGDDLYVPSYGIYPVTIVHGLGSEGPSSEKHMAALEEVGGLDMTTSYTLYAPERKDYTNSFRASGQLSIAARLLSQAASGDVLVGGLGKALITRHHDIGVVFAHPYSPQSMSLISVQSALSVAPKQELSTAGATFQASAALSSMIEGSVSQQILNGPAGLSTAELFWSANFSQQPFYYTPASVLAASNEPSARDIGAAGYDVITARGGSLYFRSDAASYLILGGLKGAGSFVRDPVRAAVDAAKITDLGAARKKYASVSPADGALTLTATDIVTGVGDFPESLPFTRTYRSDASMREQLYTSGTSYETNVAVGSSSSTYNWSYSGPDTNAASHLGAGWTHNYNVTVALSGNGARSLGSERALDATSAIAAVWSILDAYKSPSFDVRLTSVFATYWLSKEFSFGSATLEKGGRTEVLQRLSDGSFLSSAGDAKLVQSGQPTLELDFSPVRLRYTGRDGDTIDFSPSIRSKAPYSGNTVKAEPIFKADKWSFPGGVVVSFEYVQDWMLTSWTMNAATKTYCDLGAASCDGFYSDTHPDGAVLTKVSNNLGRSLTFSRESTPVWTYPKTGFGSVQLASTHRISAVTDENGRHVDYSLEKCANLRLLCETFKVAVFDGANTLYERYDYTTNASNPIDSLSLYSSYRLRKWYSPANAANPYGSVSYDALYHVTALTDRLERTTNYYPGGVMGGERWKRSQVVSPRKDRPEVTTQIFDEKNSLLVNIDPLDRKTVNTYDSMARLVRSERPLNDAEERSYDFRGNVVGVCQIPKARFPNACVWSQSTPSVNLVSRTTYKEGESVLFCADYVLCNKTASETDARGSLTSYSWFEAANDPRYGLIRQVKAPLPLTTDTVNPQIDLDYAAYSVGTGSVQRLTTKTEKISSSDSLVTRYDYSTSGNRLVPLSVTVDSVAGGKNLRTCYGFDAVGNLTSVTDPRASACP